MADFSLQDLWWLKPKGPDNPLPALQLGASIAQHRAQMDIQEGQLANDIARTSLMREAQKAKLAIQTKLDAGNAEIAKAIAGVTDWTDPEQVKNVYSVGAQYPMVVGGKAWAGAEYMERNAKAAKLKSASDVGTAESVVTGVDEQGNPITENFVRFGKQIFRSTKETVATEPKTGRTYIKSGTGAIHVLDSGDQGAVTTDPVTGQKSIQTIPMLDENGKSIGRGYVGAKGNIIRIPENNMHLMTDVEAAERRDLIKQRKDAEAELGQINGGKPPEPAHAPFGVGPKILGSSQKTVDEYTAKTNEIATIDSKLAEIKARAEGRSKTPRAGLQTAPVTPVAPVPIAPENNPKAAEIRSSLKAGKITKEQALQQLRELGFE